MFVLQFCILNSAFLIAFKRLTKSARLQGLLRFQIHNCLYGLPCNSAFLILHSALKGVVRVRPSWDEYYLEIAVLIAGRSTCLRRKVGALLVKDKRLLTTGYNGAPAGMKHCAEIGCIRQLHNIPSGERHELCRGLHAEQNAIIQGALHGVSIAGAELYCTHHPCSMCAKMLVNAGVKKVVLLDKYPDLLAEEILKEARIDVINH